MSVFAYFYVPWHISFAVRISRTCAFHKFPWKFISLRFIILTKRPALCLFLFIFMCLCTFYLLRYLTVYSKCVYYGIIKVVVLLVCAEVWVVLFDLLGAFEEEACLACVYHSEVVIAVACGNGFKANGLKRLNC